MFFEFSTTFYGSKFDLGGLSRATPPLITPFLIVYSLLTFASGDVIVLIFFFVGVTFSLVAFIFLVSLWFSFSEQGTCFMVCALLLRHVKQMSINEKMSMSKYISDLCRYKTEDTIHSSPSILG